MKRARLRAGSLRAQLLLVLLSVSALLAASVFAYASFTQRTLLAEIRGTNQSMLELYADQFDQLCVRANRCLSTLLLEYDLTADDLPSRLSDELAKDILLYEDQVSFFFSAPRRGEYVFQTASGITRREREDFSGFFYGLTGGESSPGWELRLLNGRAYLTRYYARGGCCLGAWFSLDNALGIYAANRFDAEGALLFAGTDGGVLCAGRDDLDGGDLAALEGSGDYLLLRAPLRESELTLALAIPYRAILRSLRLVQLVEALTLLVMLAAIPVLLYYLNRLVVRPMDALAGAMDRVRAGDLRVQLAPAQEAEEFRRVSATFNGMVTEIRDLKIENYEQQLNAQRLELERLQQQVKPHFFLNCLNMLYNLAEGEEYGLIQSLCMALVEYFRYMLKASAATVTIGEEFRHIRNYLRIQQLRFPDRFRVELDLEPGLEGARIPPLTLQTFAENAVKHAAARGELLLALRARACGADDVELLIEDDGPGFPPEVLERLRAGERLSDEPGAHIGIANTVQRLRLIYAGDCEVELGNREPHGARIRIRIPRGERHEPADR